MVGENHPPLPLKSHVLLVYKQITMQFDEDGNIIIPDDGSMVHTVSCDEKPGIQAIATTGDDLRTTTQNGCVMRDAEYKRLGTRSLLAGIDLHTGEAIPYVSETHKSSDFIELLKNWMPGILKEMLSTSFAIIIQHISLKRLETTLLYDLRDASYLCLHRSTDHG